MVIHGESREWVAFEQLRGASEATTIVSEPKFGKSVRRGSKRGDRSDSALPPHSTSSSHSRTGMIPPIAPPHPQLSMTQINYVGLNKESRLPSPDRRGRSVTRGEYKLEAPHRIPKPDVLRSRTASTTSATTAESGARRARSKSKERSESRGRERDTKLQRNNDRGRSRGRSIDPPLQEVNAGSRPRSSSRARSTTAVPQKGRGRSSSRSRPPLTSTNSVHRARSRSKSLTRITSPSAVSPAATCTRPPSIPIGTGIGSPRSHYSDSNIGRDISFGRAEHSSSAEGQNHKSGFMEKLFGDQVKRPKSSLPGMFASSIRPRTLLAATVYHNTATNLWITTINTNQRGVAKNPALANKYLKAFSFQSEREARESAIANAPPKMIPFNESPNCFICTGKFAVFRRASHCRNCGVCVCNNCSTTWPSKMIPDTYNLKNESFVKICKSCDMLSASFKQALLSGDYEDAVGLYGTGNVNLRTPFAVPNKKEEVMYPIHCAVQGGNLEIIRWLVEDHFCPVKLIRTGIGKKSKRGVDALILTSKGRSVLSIALDRLKVDVMRYLVVDCGVSIYESTDLKASLRALEAALVTLPPSKNPRPTLDEPFSSARWDKASFDELSDSSSLGTHDDYIEVESIGIRSNHTRGSRGDCCIICFEKKINCVATPCGHQVCCLDCSNNLSSCPVCNNRGDFIKIFRP